MIWPQFGKEELALLASVHECPRDETRFLVYADWLEERGDPLADFIRFQCEMEHVADGTDPLASLRKREAAAKRGRIDGWRGYRRGRNFDGGFRRGLPIIRWRCSDRDFARNEGCLERYMSPRHGVDLKFTIYNEAGLPRLFASPLFRQIRRLHLIGPLVAVPFAGDRHERYGKASLKLLGEQGFGERLEEFHLEYGSWRPYDPGGADLGLA